MEHILEGYWKSLRGYNIVSYTQYYCMSCKIFIHICCGLLCYGDIISAQWIHEIYVPMHFVIIYWHWGSHVTAPMSRK